MCRLVFLFWYRLALSTYLMILAEASFGFRVLSLPASVCLSMSQPWACLHDNFWPFQLCQDRRMGTRGAKYLGWERHFISWVGGGRRLTMTFNFHYAGSTTKVNRLEKIHNSHNRIDYLTVPTVSSLCNGLTSYTDRSCICDQSFAAVQRVVHTKCQTNKQNILTRTV